MQGVISSSFSEIITEIFKTCNNTKYSLTSNNFLMLSKPNSNYMKQSLSYSGTKLN